MTVTKLKLRPIKRIYCKHEHHNHWFDIETNEGDVSFCICNDCYDRLKGAVLQTVINEAAKGATTAMPRVVTR